VKSLPAQVPKISLPKYRRMPKCGQIPGTRFRIINEVHLSHSTAENLFFVSFVSFVNFVRAFLNKSDTHNFTEDFSQSSQTAQSSQSGPCAINNSASFVYHR
jgi:hypothetical protein